MKIVAAINVRMTSERLPGKAVLPLGGQPALFHHVDRLRSLPAIDEVWLATTINDADLPLVEAAETLGIPCYRGAEEDIVERYLAIGNRTGADVLVRCGCDKPLFSREALASMIDGYSGEDYCFIASTVPVGFTTELVTPSALRETHEHYRGTAITQFIREMPHLFTIRTVTVDPIFARPEFRIALDTPEDYQVLNAIFDALYDGSPVDLRTVFRYLDDHPEVARLNRASEDKPVNAYVKQLLDRPVATIHSVSGGFTLRDRMGNVIPDDEIAVLLERVRASLTTSEEPKRA